MSMAVMMSKTRDLIEDLVKDSSWALTRRASFHGSGGDEDDEFGDLSRSPSGSRTNSIAALSPVANLVVARCSLILGVSVEDLQHSFDAAASETIKRPSHYARNLVEYCCFRTIALSIQVAGYLSDKNFRRLTFDMMLAWDAPFAATQPSSPQAKVDKERTVGMEAFCRIAPAIPSIADVVCCSNLFSVLTASKGGRLSFAKYEKYIASLDRAIKKMKTQSESSLLSDLRFHRGERILDVDGTLTAQPVLEHVGMSAWPGKLMLTDHALYFEALKVVTYDKPKVYDLADDLKQCVKPELTGPWGSRLFDKAVMYKSIALLEPIFIEFPELTGHSRRDYWLAVTREVLYAHRFIRKLQIDGVEKEETLLKAVMGIMRLQALLELLPSQLIKCETILTFNLCDQLPGGDLILETLASMMKSRRLGHNDTSASESPTYSTSALGILSHLGVMSQVSTEKKLLIGELIVGEMTALERVAAESMSNYRKVEQAMATVDVVKVDGLDTNLALTKELLHPFIQLGNFLLLLAYWDDPAKSSMFCCACFYIILSDLETLPSIQLPAMTTNKDIHINNFKFMTLIFSYLSQVEALNTPFASLITREHLKLHLLHHFFYHCGFTNNLGKGWLGYALVTLLLLVATFILLTRFINQGRPLDEIKVMVPPSMNTMEQLLAVQNAISQLEEFLKDANVVLLKLRALLLAVPSQAINTVVLALVLMAVILAFLPGKVILAMIFLELFTMHSPPRRASTERSTRRLREWWFRIPAAPVLVEREKEEKI